MSSEKLFSALFDERHGDKNPVFMFTDILLSWSRIFQDYRCLQTISHIQYPVFDVCIYHSRTHTALPVAVSQQAGVEHVKVAWRKDKLNELADPEHSLPVILLK